MKKALAVSITLSLLIPIIIITLLAVNITPLRVGVDFILREFDGNSLIENEGNVRQHLLTILDAPENYSIAAFTRKAISLDLEKTDDLYHSFFVLRSRHLPFFFTLSFSGTDKWFFSQGAWAINSDYDIASYVTYRHGNNEWDVEEMFIENGINLEMTLRTIIQRIEDGIISYFYNDHIDYRPNMENCNTAMFNTIVSN